MAVAFVRKSRQYAGVEGWFWTERDACRNARGRRESVSLRTEGRMLCICPEMPRDTLQIFCLTDGIGSVTTPERAFSVDEGSFFVPGSGFLMCDSCCY